VAKVTLIEALRRRFYVDEGVVKLSAGRRGRPAGSPVGGSGSGGYRRITTTIGKRNFSLAEHHVVIMLTTGARIPKGMVVDHLDGNRANNRIENLRIVTQQINGSNSCKTYGELGLRGLSRFRNKYRVSIDGEYLGLFESAQAGVEQYWAKSKLKDPVGVAARSDFYVQQVAAAKILDAEKPFVERIAATPLNKTVAPHICYIAPGFRVQVNHGGILRMVGKYVAFSDAQDVLDEDALVGGWLVGVFKKYDCWRIVLPNGKWAKFYSASDAVAAYWEMRRDWEKPGRAAKMREAQLMIAADWDNPDSFKTCYQSFPSNGQISKIIPGYQVQIKDMGITKYVGKFGTLEEASTALSAAQEEAAGRSLAEAPMALEEALRLNEWRGEKSPLQKWGNFGLASSARVTSKDGVWLGKSGEARATTRAERALARVTAERAADAWLGQA